MLKLLTPHKLNAQESRRVLYPSCIVASRYWRVLVLTGCLFKSEIGNRKTDELFNPPQTECAVQAYGGHLAYATCWYTVVYCNSELGTWLPANLADSNSELGKAGGPA